MLNDEQIEVLREDLGQLVDLVTLGGMDCFMSLTPMNRLMLKRFSSML